VARRSRKPLSLGRLILYVIIFAVCGAAAAREVYYALAGDITTGTVTWFGKNTRFASRSSTYWAEYEYFDSQGTRHTGRASTFTLSLDAAIPATTHVGDAVEVQYLRHSPESSRLVPSPAGGLCFGFMALLAAVAFIAELAVRRRRRRPSTGDSPTEP